MPTRVFLCHSSKNSDLVIEVGQYLERNLKDVFYYEKHQRSDQDFQRTINEALHECQIMVVFVDDYFQSYRKDEANAAYPIDEANAAYRMHEQSKMKKKSFFLVMIGHGDQFPEVPPSLSMLGGFPMMLCDKSDPDAAFKCAQKIVGEGISIDDLPLNPHLFSYEKDIIESYMKNSDAQEHDQKTQEMILRGCPKVWPPVERRGRAEKRNRAPQDVIGTFRPDEPSNDARVVAAALSGYHTGDKTIAWPDSCLLRRSLCFPEAGPRERLYFPTGATLRLKAAILVSGGIAPGINAVIDGIVQRHWLYAEHHGYQRSLYVYGIQNGFRAFFDDEKKPCDITPAIRTLIANEKQREILVPQQGLPPMLETSDHAHEGGSILGTSRVDELIDIGQREKKLESIIAELRRKDIDILYIIGGDGSMKAAHALASVVKRKDAPLSVVAIPKTMDNDILWVWQSFGFLSAVEKAREVIEVLHTEVKSNPRLCILQLFGSDSGFVVSHAVLASGTGHCDVALIPEIDFSIPALAAHLRKRFAEKGGNIPYGLVVMAETAVPEDAENYLEDMGIGLSDDEKKQIKRFRELKKEKRRIEGQTNDLLRTAGLKIVKEGLKKEFERDWPDLRVFSNEPRHLLRAITPSCSDIISGQRLGTLAVDNAVAGYTDFMISQWLTEYVLVPLRLTTLGRKRIPQSGIFWNSVRAKTGQPQVLV